MKTQMQAYGAAVVACATSEARWTFVRQGIERFGWYPTGGFVAPPIGSPPYGIEGYKTLAYEVAEQLEWVAPDVCVVPSSYSDGLFGMWKGWTELETLGLVKTAPRMIAAEPFGPLAAAMERGLDVPPVVAGGSSVAFSIMSRYGTYQGLTALKQSGGAGERVTDEGVLEAQRALAHEEGLYVEPSSAAALTAVMQMRARGALDRDHTVVIVLTSDGLKDPATSRTWMPPVPAAPADLDAVLHLVRDTYGIALR
jgi:threonine synthase